MLDPRTQDTRICMLGDSMTHGVGDPAGQGWAGRVAERRRHEGWTLTSYDLGVRRDTGPDLVRRLPEVTARLTGGERYGLVISFGGNDTHLLDGSPRASTDESVGALATLLGAAAAHGWGALVIGPPPVLDPQHSARLRLLSDCLATCCDTTSVRFAASYDLLEGDPVWESALQAGDGIHPSATGYALWAGRLDPAFTAWLGARWT